MMKLRQNRILHINAWLLLCLQALILTNASAKSFLCSMYPSSKIANITSNTVIHFDKSKWRQLNYQYSVAGRVVCSLILDKQSANCISVKMHSGETNISIKGSGRTIYIYLTNNPSKYFEAETQPGVTLWKIIAKYIADLLPQNGLHALLLSKDPIPPAKTLKSISHVDGDTVIRCITPDLTDKQLNQLNRKTKAMNIEISEKEYNMVFMNLYAPYYLIINSQNSLPIEIKYGFAVPDNRSNKLLYVIERFQFHNVITTKEIRNYKPSIGSETVSFGYFLKTFEASESHVL